MTPNFPRITLSIPLSFVSTTSDAIASDTSAFDMLYIFGISKRGRLGVGFLLLDPMYRIEWDSYQLFDLAASSGLDAPYHCQGRERDSLVSVISRALFRQPADGIGVILSWVWLSVFHPFYPLF